MLTRRALLPLLALPLARLAGQTEVEKAAAALVADLAESLSGDNPARFVKQLDKAIEGYERLRTDAYALVDQCEIVCSIEILEQSGDAEQQKLVTDWLITLYARGGAGREERRQRVELTLIKSGRWSVTALKPLDLLRPLRVV